MAETRVAPAAQTEQPAAPPYEYEFDPHVEHAVALNEYCPAGQGEQEDAPGAGATKPAGHGVQKDDAGPTAA